MLNGNGRMNNGEYALSAFMYRKQPGLILCGHDHERQIHQDEETGTWIINPGNLGRYKDCDFGNFLEIEVDTKNMDKPDCIKPIARYYSNPGGAIIRTEL